MAEKTIKHGSFWYLDKNDRHVTALRGDTVDIPNDDDLERGERLGAFATKQDLAEGTPFASFLASRDTAGPGVVELDPSDVEGRTSPAGSADPAIQSGTVAPTGTPAPTSTTTGRTPPAKPIK